MPRVYKQKAGKDYPGIKKGEVYYSWSFFKGPTLRSATYPLPSQLTQREAYSTALAAWEGYEYAVAAATSLQDLTAAAEDLRTGLEEAIDTANDVISNLSDAFQGGNPTIDEYEDALASMESLQAEAEALSFDADDYPDGLESAKEAARDLGGLDF